MTISKKTPALLALAISLFLQAGLASAGEPWWPGLKKELMEKNPKIAAGRRKVEALAHIPQSKLALADPMISAGLMSVPVDSFRLDKEDMTQKFIEFRQDVPAWSMRQANAQMAHAAIHTAKAELNMDAVMAAMDLKMAVNETIFTRRAREILDDTGFLLDKLERTTMAKYSSGKDAQANVILAQLEKSKILQKQLKLEEHLQLARIKINRLLARDPNAPFTPPAEYLPPEPRIETEGMAQGDHHHSPRVAMARAMEVEAAAALAEAEASKSLMWTFSATYGQRDRGPEMARPDLVSVMAGVTIPLYKSGKQERVIAGAKVGVMEKAELSRDAEVETTAQISSALASLAQEEKIIDIYDSGLIPQATLALESAMAGYQLARTDFTTLIMNQMNLLDMRMELEMARMRVADLYARLDSLKGPERMEE